MSVVSITVDDKRTAGRPRSEESRKAILDAAARLLASIPLKNLAIESIAREAGVGKATIYRWWPNKAALAIDAFFEEIEQRSSFLPAPTATAALGDQVMRLVQVTAGPVGRLAAQIIAEGQSDPAVLELFRTVFVRQRRAVATQLIKEGIAKGEFRDDIDAELAIDLIYGAVWYRLMVGHQPLDSTFADSMAKYAVALLRRV